MAKVITVDGIQCEMTDTAAQVVARSIAASDAILNDAEIRVKALETQLATVTADATTAAATAKTALDTAAGQVVALTQQLKDAAMTPEKLDILVKDRALVVTAAKVLVPALVADGKTVEAIRREAVTAKIGDAATKAMSDDAIAGAFVAFTATKDGQPPISGPGHLAQSFNQPVLQDASAKEAAWVKQGQDLKDAWKTKAH